MAGIAEEEGMEEAVVHIEADKEEVVEEEEEAVVVEEEEEEEEEMDARSGLK